jgi:glycerophosphoryl diester phosphodiesterase
MNRVASAGMANLAWLTARPIAHRGLHDAGARIVENTSSAVSAAIAHNYGIEVDLQITADGEAMVYHDEVLGRLTEGKGKLAEMSAAELQRVRFKATDDRMMTLDELCEIVAGRVTLVLEMKSVFDGDGRLACRTANVLDEYKGPVAVMSFDPHLVAVLKSVAPSVVRGITAMGHYDDGDAEWQPLSRWQKRLWPHVWPGITTWPHFVAYALRDLPTPVLSFARGALHMPVLAWVARSQADRDYVSRFADQIIFEGFAP